MSVRTRKLAASTLLLMTATFGMGACLPGQGPWIPTDPEIPDVPTPDLPKPSPPKTPSP